MIDKIIPQIKVYLLYRVITPGVYGCQEVIGVYSRQVDAEKFILELSTKFSYRIEERVLQ